MISCNSRQGINKAHNWHTFHILSSMISCTTGKVKFLRFFFSGRILGLIKIRGSSILGCRGTSNKGKPCFEIKPSLMHATINICQQHDERRIFLSFWLCMNIFQAETSRHLGRKDLLIFIPLNILGALHYIYISTRSKCEKR